MASPPTSDRDQILEIIGRYAHAVDARDVTAVAACFTPDGAIEFGDAAPVRGADAIRAFFRDALQAPRMGAQGASTHLMANTVVTFDGDASASATTSAVSFHTAVGRATMVLRGLRYDDTLAQTDGTWLLAHRRHTCTWEASTPGATILPTSVT
ncbi:MAG TPA: nuclear transport factor 2 family protein [Acidimicrobiales bacterium]|jgi:uncharacterized protein (TIGR02246 family)|nr:nuclear transport factor 2 family protein [Acidimicrobiales bacterium]